MHKAFAASPRRTLVLRLLAGGTLVAGYADLARGGMTLAPMLLIAGYLVLVPALLLDWP